MQEEEWSRREKTNIFVSKTKHAKCRSDEALYPSQKDFDRFACEIIRCSFSDISLLFIYFMIYLLSII